MVPNWSKEHFLGRVLGVMPCLTQTSTCCWRCQIAWVHLKFHVKLIMMVPDTNLFLYANVNLVINTYQIKFLIWCEPNLVFTFLFNSKSHSRNLELTLG